MFKRKVIDVNYEELDEMSRIGFTDDGFEVYIRTDDPGKIPHFHYRNKDRSVNTCIQICTNEYFEHGEYRGKLNAKQRKNLQKLMNFYIEEADRNTWEYIVLQWNMNNSDVKISLRDIKQPNYSTIKDYKG